MDKIKQISIDVRVSEIIDGTDLASEILKCLENNGFTIVGIDFKEDLTDEYKDDYPEILE